MGWSRGDSNPWPSHCEGFQGSGQGVMRCSVRDHGVHGVHRVGAREHNRGTSRDCAPAHRPLRLRDGLTDRRMPPAHLPLPGSPAKFAEISPQILDVNRRRTSVGQRQGPRLGTSRHLSYTEFRTDPLHTTAADSHAPLWDRWVRLVDPISKHPARACDVLPTCVPRYEHSSGPMPISRFRMARRSASSGSWSFMWARLEAEAPTCSRSRSRLRTRSEPSSTGRGFCPVATTCSWTTSAEPTPLRHKGIHSSPPLWARSQSACRQFASARGHHHVSEVRGWRSRPDPRSHSANRPAGTPRVRFTHPFECRPIGARTRQDVSSRTGEGTSPTSRPLTPSSAVYPIGAGGSPSTRRWTWGALCWPSRRGLAPADPRSGCAHSSADEVLQSLACPPRKSLGGP